MAFLNKTQVGELIGKIKRLFSQQKQKGAKKSKSRIFFALEPKLGFVHILAENMKAEVLKLLAQESRELKKFSDGLQFKEIPMKQLRDWTLQLDESYRKVKPWGTGLKFNAFFSKGKIFFKLLSLETSETLENEFDLVSGGKVFISKRELLERASSHFNLDNYFKSLATYADPELVSNCIKLFQEQLENSINKLCPPEEGRTLCFNGAP